MTKEEAEEILLRGYPDPVWTDHYDQECKKYNEAISLATEALQIVELIDKTFKWNSDLMMDFEDWQELLAQVRGE